MAKKIIAILIALVLTFSFSSCSSQGQQDKTTEKSTEEITTKETTTEVNMNVDLKKVYDECVVKMPEMISLDNDMILDFCGVNSEDCDECYVSICADSLRTDEIWLIKVKNENSVQTIVDLANARIKAKGDESKTYSPEQYAIVQKAEIITKGEYIAVIVSPDVSSIAEIVNNAY